MEMEHMEHDDMAFRSSPSTAPELTHGHVAIVGCCGKMGAMLMRRLQEGGYVVAGTDIPLNDDKLARVCSEADIVLPCVPASTMDEVLQKLVPHMAASTILADITSVKVQPMFQMEKYWPGIVVGTHPLFGPRTDPGMKLPVAIVPGRHADEAALCAVENMFVSFGCTVFRTTAEEHDKAMAWIQGMNFVSSVAYLAMTGDNDWLKPFVTPSFRRRLVASRKLLLEDSGLFTGLFEANPYSLGAVRHYQRLLKAASGGDIDLLVQKAKSWWADENTDR